jgi:hypothetical protein
VPLYVPLKREVIHKQVKRASLLALQIELFPVLKSLKAILIKHLLKLVIERSRPVMSFLGSDVIPSFIQHRFTDAHDKVLVLPCKSRWTKLVLIYPMGRFALDLLHYPGQCLVNAEGDEAMRMFTKAIYVVDKDALTTGRVIDMLKYSLANVIV